MLHRCMECSITFHSHRPYSGRQDRRNNWDTDTILVCNSSKTGATFLASEELNSYNEVTVRRMKFKSWRF